MGGLGTPEILIILVIALIVFGPRKLPELGKSMGKAINQFRRASEDFKRTWEQEVDLESTRKSITPTDPVTSSEPYSAHQEANYNPYDSSYGYNSPSDAEAASILTETPKTEAASAETAAIKPVTQSKPQPGQWI